MTTNYNLHEQDQCLLFLHRHNAYNIEVVQFTKYIDIRALLPNQNSVTVTISKEPSSRSPTITCDGITVEFDPTSNEANHLYFLL